MGARDKKLKAYVRLDSQQSVVPSSLVLRRSKPKNGRFIEITSNTCCDVGATVKVDITALNLTGDATVTVTVGCGSGVTITNVALTTTGGSEALKRANLVSQLNSTFVGLGVFTLSTANEITFVSSGDCLKPSLVVTP